MEYYSATKKNKIMPFAATWMDLETLILSEGSQKDKYHIILVICHIYNTAQMNLFTKQKQTDIYREPTCGCQGGEGWGGMDWEFGFSRCKLLYIEWININVLLYKRGNYIQCLVINFNGKECDKYVYI